MFHPVATVKKLWYNFIMNSKDKWSLDVFWKNSNDGSTVKAESHYDFKSRMEAEGYFINLPFEYDSNIIPVGFLTSPFNMRFTLDPYGYWVKYYSHPV